MDLALEDQLEIMLHRLDEHQAIRLEEIQAALDRLDDGSYGSCLGCGLEIPQPRLDVLPAARMCRECQELVEAGAPLATEIDDGW